MTRQLRFSRASNSALAQNGAHQFAAKHALCHYGSDAVYTFIPKNACSTMRLSLAIANGCIHDVNNHAWIHSNNATFVASLRDLMTAKFTFVILRDPFDRLSSVYLDKIVNREPHFWNFYEQIGREHEPDAITFRLFVEIVTSRLLTSNTHWRPQSHFLVYDDYDLWVPFEHLAEYTDEIEARTGLKINDARPFTRHGTDRFQIVDDGCFADRSPAEIRQMNLDGRIPSHQAMYDDALRAKVAKAYAADFALYGRHFPLEVDTPTKTLKLVNG